MKERMIIIFMLVVVVLWWKLRTIHTNNNNIMIVLLLVIFCCEASHNNHTLWGGEGYTFDIGIVPSSGRRGHCPNTPCAYKIYQEKLFRDNDVIICSVFWEQRRMNQSQTRHPTTNKNINWNWLPYGTTCYYSMRT